MIITTVVSMVGYVCVRSSMLAYHWTEAMTCVHSTDVCISSFESAAARIRTESELYRVGVCLDVPRVFAAFLVKDPFSC